MNINPKKSWHVRSKQNLAKVRKDEAKAAEEEKEKQRRIDLAESEARSELLRKFASTKAVPEEVVETSVQEKKLTHVNFFEELEAGDKVLKRNKEHEAEKKREKEKLEKDVGLLTYLGQGSAEFEDKKPWYLDSSKKATLEKDEVQLKTKLSLDPLSDMQHYLELNHKYERIKKGEDVKQRKHKHRHTRTYKETSRKTLKAVKSMREMREERIARERKERLRSERLLKGEKDGGGEKEVVVDVRKMSYNSRFNPELPRFKG